MSSVCLSFFIFFKFSFILNFKLVQNDHLFQQFMYGYSYILTIQAQLLMCSNLHGANFYA